jgi:hypothetical protein
LYFLTKLPFISLALILRLAGVVEMEGALGGLPLSGLRRSLFADVILFPV